jgi:hypothetical protein
MPQGTLGVALIGDARPRWIDSLPSDAIRLAGRCPELRSDAAAEAFLDQDLSDPDFSQFRPTPFEFEKKMTQLNMRLPASCWMR